MKYFALEDGSLEVSTSDFVNIDFFVKDLKITLPIYHSNGKQFNSSLYLALLIKMKFLSILQAKAYP